MTEQSIYAKAFTPEAELSKE